MSLHQISDSERQRAATTRARLERLGVTKIAVPKFSPLDFGRELSPVLDQSGSNPIADLAKSEAADVSIVNEAPTETPLDRIEFLIESMEHSPPINMFGETTTHRIIRVVAEAYDLRPRDVTGERRLAHFVRARHIVMWLARTLTQKSLPAIGRAIGGKDHSTILHGIRNIEYRRHSDPQLQAELDRLLLVLRPAKSNSSEDADVDPGNPFPAVG